MKAADKVTSIRIVLAPIFFALYAFTRPVYDTVTNSGHWWSVPVLWIILIVAELTDMLDGKIARKRGEVSDFGKFYDPFADTLTQITFFFCFVWDGILPLVPFLLVLYREFGILFIRNLMLKKGISMGARLGGKIKTVAYIIAAILALGVSSLERLFPLWLKAGFDAELHNRLRSGLSLAAGAVFCAAVLVALLSFADYIRVYRNSPAGTDKKA
ncbi:CDP-diacylglycerol--glycerol-3-phosphate 3-phosphatidyltransferase [Spirochaetia bacterium]|nr:CDP-diacylglycerol--glycerol-3-phosphate 3-phosphatidyltransferase [Spirochaetia bacterium]